MVYTFGNLRFVYTPKCKSTPVTWLRNDLCKTGERFVYDVQATCDTDIICPDTGAVVDCITEDYLVRLSFDIVSRSFVITVIRRDEFVGDVIESQVKADDEYSFAIFMRQMDDRADLDDMVQLRSDIIEISRQIHLDNFDVDFFAPDFVFVISEDDDEFAPYSFVYQSNVHPLCF